MWFRKLPNCYNCSNIIGINNSDNFDAENNQCQCGAGSVFFYTKNQCINDNSNISIDTTNSSIYENDYNKVCLELD